MLRCYFRRLAVALTTAVLATSCSSAENPGTAGTTDATHAATVTLILYTSVNQQTLDAVVGAFHSDQPDVHVAVFRAPTGALNARIAAEKRSGGVKADIFWVSDPLTMHGYDAQGLLAKYTAPSAAALPAEFRTSSFAGAGLLYLVMVYRQGLSPAPEKWADLANPAYRGRVAIPDPGFAGSAMGALGYFGEQRGFGLDFYRSLKANGTVQVKSPDDVINGVAQGRYQVGMTIADSALNAAKKGAPIAVAWPAPGAIAIYSPIGVAAASRHRDVAEAFDDFVLSEAGQRAIAQSGREPSLPSVPGIDKPATAPVVSPDWETFFDHKDALFNGYQKIFGS